MAFNHYAKIRRILANEPNGWYVKIIREPTSAQNFKGEIVNYDHYYRIYRVDGTPIKYCKFQKLDKFAKIMSLSEQDIPVVE